MWWWWLFIQHFSVHFNCNFSFELYHFADNEIIFCFLFSLHSKKKIVQTFRLLSVAPQELSVWISNLLPLEKQTTMKKKLCDGKEKIRAPKNSRSIIGKIQNSTKNYLTATAFALRLFETKNNIYFLLKSGERERERILQKENFFRERERIILNWMCKSFCVPLENKAYKKILINWLQCLIHFFFVYFLNYSQEITVFFHLWSGSFHEISYFFLSATFIYFIPLLETEKCSKKNAKKVLKYLNNSLSSLCTAFSRRIHSMCESFLPFIRSLPPASSTKISKMRKWNRVTIRQYPFRTTFSRCHAGMEIDKFWR